MIRTAEQILRDVEANPEAEPLTDRERQVLNFIADHIARHGRPPLMREIGSSIGLSWQTSLGDVLNELERKGRLQPRQGRHRRIALVNRDGQS